MKKESFSIFSDSTKRTVIEPNEGRIVVKRDQLETLEAFAGTLLHETGHAVSRALDISRTFESELTRIIGLITSKALEES